MSSFYNNLTGPTGAQAPQNSTGFKQFKEKVPTGFKAATLQQFTPEQMQLYQEMFGHLGQDSFLGKLAAGDQSTFNEMEAPAMRQFNELQGGLASRFSGGGLGGRQGSGFQNASNAATSNFAQDLQARRSDLRRQAINDLMGLSNQLLGQRPYDRALVEHEKEKTWGQKLGGGVLRAAGTATGAYFGGPQGAKAGYQASDEMGKSFGI